MSRSPHLQPSPRPEISLGDLTDALRVLRPRDVATRQAIAQVLGLEPRAVPEKSGKQTPDATETRGRESGPESGPETALPPDPMGTGADRRRTPSPPARYERPELALQKPRRSVLETLSTASRSHAPPIEVPSIDELLASETDLDDGEHSDSETLDTALFVGRWRRALLTTALSTSDAEGEVDVETLVGRLSQAEPIRDLPRRALPTLRHGVQLLLDHGEGMQPFTRDRAEMTTALRETVGEDRLQILRFAGSPRIAGAGARRSWTAYEAPQRGRPVLALTDLGLAGVGATASPEDWLSLAARLAPRGSRLVVFVPYPPKRWPRRLAGRLTLVRWDRGTGVHDVRRALTARSPAGAPA